MSTTVTVRFAVDREYTFDLTDNAVATLEPDAARSWLAHQMDALECDMPNKMGKILAADIALALAHCAGESLFAEGGEWAQCYAQAVAAIFDRPVVLVDVEQNRIG
ncbi:hypothetical protein [Hydrogenophilus thermoluteolus]|jgi:hypothetical protein|uniref:Uncharacterized protein n=1 Tax=Hydrogenophilus thermoluteolus TaxID=297 RepID=A0A2Z6E012_HYDTE|nr:hypothetical protein [Hydrogenophilus thermoluteolus]HCO77786.1 hypothetical protein [Rhodocyclaceae bacterium]MBW7656192.1 hypothetical protein [Hydrogenophilus thermoluteolus]BBD78131.1 hypothetical protein HPTL_1875 [Hydrogenophilus thermoluteolus]GLW61446.1 hypothetical protein Hthe01_17950 [Hydrogenophilus thermoluteolus]HNQ49673.1 hypothetical protein [Hydrogenophilus thermoluteolus]